MEGGLRVPQAGDLHLPVMLRQVLAAFERYVSSEVDVVGRLEVSRMQVAIEWRRRYIHLEALESEAIRDIVMTTINDWGVLYLLLELALACHGIQEQLHLCTVN